MIANMPSIRNDEMGTAVSMNGTSMRVPVQVMIGAMSRPSIVVEAETNRVSAKKMLSVPSVTMNGGNRRRVMSRPLRSPAAVPKMKPRPSAATPGTPKSAESLPMTIETKTAMAPTERSIPAVRMMMVCPMASVPTNMTCWTIRLALNGVRKRSLPKEKTTSMTLRKTSGASHGYLCSRRWRRCKPVGFWRSASVISPPTDTAACSAWSSS